MTVSISSLVPIYREMEAANYTFKYLVNVLCFKAFHFQDREGGLAFLEEQHLLILTLQCTERNLLGADICNVLVPSFLNDRVCKKQIFGLA